MCGVPIHRADEYLQRLIRPGLPRRRLRAARGPGRGEEARLQGGGAPRRGAPRHARHAHRGQPARRQGAQLPDRRCSTAPKAGAARGRHDRAGLARHLDRRVRGGRGAGGRLARRDRAPLAGRGDRRRPRCSPTSDVAAWIGIAGAAATPVAGASFDSLAGERLLKAQLGVADLGAFGDFSRAELAAVGALLKYVELTQIGKRPCLRPPRRAGPANRLVIDAREPRQPGAAALARRARGRAACSPPSTAPSPAPARASWPRGWRARCATWRDRRAARRGRLPARRARRCASDLRAALLRAAPDIARAHLAARPAARRAARSRRRARWAGSRARPARDLLRRRRRRHRPARRAAPHRRAAARLSAAICTPCSPAALVDEPPHLQARRRLRARGLPRRARRGARACATTAAR